MPTPWSVHGRTDPDREYLALLTFLPLKHFRALPRFVLYTIQIQRQLRRSAGLAGYALHAEPLKLKFWTLSVWDGEDALKRFVREMPHGKVMRSLAPHMDRTRFTQWQVKGTSVPPNWEDAFDRERRGEPIVP